MVKKVKIVYTKGRELTESEVEALKKGDLVWIFWSKDNNPEWITFNEARPVKDSRLTYVDVGREFWDGANWWPCNGDTGRGQAYYYQAFCTRGDVK